MKWSQPTVESNGHGAFAIYAHAPGKPNVEITYFRGVPVQLKSFSFGEPFGDSVAEMTFPQVTPFDDLQSRELWWVNEWTDIDIYWVPATSSQLSSLDVACINPDTQKYDLWLNYGEKVALWEGFVTAYTPGDDGMQVQCQGALFQHDRFLAKPKYRPQPAAMEAQIVQYFDPRTNNVRTKPIIVDFPVGWTKIWDEITQYPYTPWGVNIGQLWSGYSTRNTGSWDRLLTGYTQNLLSQMYTTDDCGVTPGNQWTIRKYAGRQPKLEIRDRFADEDFELWYGTPGTKVSLSRDGLSIVNIVYGQGTGIDGNVWSNMKVSDDGRETAYGPIAHDPNLYPIENALKSKSAATFQPAESLVKFDSGVSLYDASVAAQQMLRRDSDPGWNGTIDLEIDPSNSLTKWEIRPGMVVLLKGYLGIKEGIKLHIAEVVASPQSGNVSLKVDSRFRDLLTLEEVQARVRDPLTPSKMLQVNRRSVTIEDQLAPWDHEGGSGICPSGAQPFFKSKPDNIDFPWYSWTEQYPPSQYPEYYVKIDAGSSTSKNRWTKNIPVLMSQAGSARMVQAMMVDSAGAQLAIPFHLSIYRVNEPSLPHTGTNYSPFTEHFFSTTQPNGLPWPSGNFFQPDPSMIVGWGNYEEQAGYTPNRSSIPAADPTGILVDESGWSWSMVTNPNFNPYPREGQVQPDNARQLYFSVYAESFGAGSVDAYFICRVIRKEPGV